MLYDLSTLADHCDGDAALMRRVIDLFLADHPGQLDALRAALELRDAERICSVAHSIRGSAATFGARDAIEAARAIENSCRERRIEDAATAARELERAIHALAQSLRAAPSS